MTTQSLKDLLAFPFRGKDWQGRFLIGIALGMAGFIPLVPQLLLMGYFARILRQALQGEDLALPAWDDWGRLLLDGLRLFGANLVYMLPALIVMMGGIFAYFGGFFLSLPAMALADQSADAAMGMSLLLLVLMGIMFLSMALSNVLWLAGGIPLPAAMARIIEQDRFAAGFQLGEITRALRRNAGGFFIAWLILIGLFATGYFVFFMFYMTLFLFWVGFLVMIPLSFYLLVISAALFGQAYRESQPAAEQL